jgi:lysozyme family protein/uncharacterized protein YvpB
MNEIFNTKKSKNYFKLALDFTFKWEGGLSNDPDDYGGLTKFGVTQKSYLKWKDRSSNDVKNITKTEAKDFYYACYWIEAKCERMYLPLAIVHFDTAVNFGINNSILFLQDCIVTKQDGIWGNQTETNFLTKNNLKTAIKYVERRQDYRYKRVREDRSQEKFLKGWLNRDEDLLKYIQSDLIKKHSSNSIIKLVIKENTIAKLKPLQSVELPNNFKYSLNKGEEYTILNYSVASGHFKCKFEKELIANNKYYYLFASHVQIEDSNKKTNKDSIRLDVPYHSQLNNINNPYGSCNVTSVAMVLNYLSRKRKINIRKSGYSNWIQLEDELYMVMLDHNWNRHTPEGLASLARHYGFKKSVADRQSSIAEVEEWLINKNSPVIIHGYFTSFGHIVVVTGFGELNGEKGLWINDPYGIWKPLHNYDTNKSGYNVFYPYKDIIPACLPDGFLWAVFIN